MSLLFLSKCCCVIVTLLYQFELSGLILGIQIYMFITTLYLYLNYLVSFDSVSYIDIIWVIVRYSLNLKATLFLRS